MFSCVLFFYDYIVRIFTVLSWEVQEFYHPSLHQGLGFTVTSFVKRGFYCQVTFMVLPLGYSKLSSRFGLHLHIQGQFLVRVNPKELSSRFLLGHLCRCPSRKRDQELALDMYPRLVPGEGGQRGRIDQ